MGLYNPWVAQTYNREHLMAGEAFYNLPPALALNGGELLVAYQQGPNQATPWIGVQFTASQFSAFISEALQKPSACYVSMRQLASALASRSVLVELVQALSSDITNTYNIAWTHGYIITAADPFISGFLQPTLGYSGSDVATLFALAATFPV